MPDTPASATPSNSTGRGPGTVIVALYAVLALAATGRSGLQFTEYFSRAPLAYVFSAVSAALKSVTGVRDLHDLHIWAITSGVPSLSSHLVIEHGANGESVRARASEL